MRALRWRESLPWRLEGRIALSRRFTLISSTSWQSSPGQSYRCVSQRVNYNSFFDFPPPNSTLEVTVTSPLDEIYRRAYEYGIPSPEKLAFEADVGHRSQLKSRMVDRIANRQDLELWAILFDFRFQRDGLDGVRDILYGMRFRGKPVKLYADDLPSEHIKQQLITIGADHNDILLGLVHPRNGVGRGLSHIFLDTVGQLLRLYKVQQALHVARILRTTNFRGREDLLGLFEVFRQNGKHLSIGDFCIIHKQLPQSRIYSEVVPKLWKSNRADDAWFMHSYLLSCGDLPTKFDDIESLITDLARHDRLIDPFLRSLEAAGCSFTAQTTRAFRRERAEMKVASSDVTDTGTSNSLSLRPRKLSDEFVARAFATRAFSLDFILNSLRLFGLIEIGPLAVRELALGAGNLENLRARFSKLDGFEVDLGSSNYVTVVKNLCMSGSEVLLRAVLDSDQHHEVFEDRETQKRLLANYYYENDWPQINRTLAILNHGKTDLEAQRRSRRLLLQSAIVTRDWQGALQMLTDMYKSGHTSELSNHESANMSLRSLIDIILPFKKEKRLWRQGYLKRGHYLAGILQDMTMMGMFVEKVHWRRALYSFGESGRITSLERLCIWLAWYHRNLDQNPSLRPRHRHNYEVLLNDLFDPRFQAAVIEWSYCLISGSSSDVESPSESETVQENANRGMHILRRLNAGFGVSLNYNLVKEEYSKRMHRLFRKRWEFEKHMLYFDAVWSNDLSRIPRRTDRKAIKRAQMPRFNELQSLRESSEADPVSQELDIDVSEVSLSGQRIVEEFRPFTGDEESDDLELPDDVVEYQDLFHPSSKEYRKRLP